MSAPKQSPRGIAGPLPAPLSGAPGGTRPRGRPRDRSYRQPWTPTKAQASGSRNNFRRRREVDPFARDRRRFIHVTEQEAPTRHATRGDRPTARRRAAIVQRRSRCAAERRTLRTRRARSLRVGQKTHRPLLDLGLRQITRADRSFSPLGDRRKGSTDRGGEDRGAVDRLLLRAAKERVDPRDPRLRSPRCNPFAAARQSGHMRTGTRESISTSGCVMK